MKRHDFSLPGVSNTRELGGYAIGGRRVKYGVLLRTAGLNQAAPEALDALQNRYRVQTVIDFRMSAEQGALPDPEIPGAQNIHLPVIEMEDMMAGIDPDLAAKYSGSNMDRKALYSLAYETGMVSDRLYIQFLLPERARNAWRVLFEALLALDDGRAILWHCTDGKNRTGCAAMLIRHHLG